MIIRVRVYRDQGRDFSYKPVQKSMADKPSPKQGLWKRRAGGVRMLIGYMRQRVSRASTFREATSGRCAIREQPGSTRREQACVGFLFRCYTTQTPSTAGFSMPQPSGADRAPLAP